jgi:hypothetical protein
MHLVAIDGVRTLQGTANEGPALSKRLKGRVELLRSNGDSD